MSHVLEGASQEDLNLYRAEVERDQAYGNWRDFFLNKKGSVTSVSGDANLDQIADVSYLLDTFFAKVTRTALQNAASIAGLMITTEAMVAEAPKKDIAAIHREYKQTWKTLDDELAYALWPGDVDAGNIDGSLHRWAKKEVIDNDREDWKRISASMRKQPDALRYDRQTPVWTLMVP